MNDPHHRPVGRHLGFLDGYRAGEDLAGEVLAKWAEQTASDALRGRLRVVAGREKFHARLLGERLRELGGEPRAVVTDAAYLEASRAVCDASLSDREKWEAWRRIVSHGTDTLRAQAERLSGDEETRALLLEMIVDEDATTRALKEIGSQLA